MPRHGDARQEVQEVIRNLRRALNAGDVDRLLQIADQDLEIMPPGRSALAGSQAHEFFRDLMSQFKAELEPFTNEEIIVCGDWAFQRYSYALTLTPKTGGDSIVERGDGIHMFRRDAAGAWRLAKDIFTSVARAA